MSRMNTLLRASLEASQPVAPTDPMASLEAYEEYRIALEEHTAAVDLVEQLGDMSEGLIEIEGLVDESRGDGTLSEDQVALQVDAVNKVREVLEGDITEISMESFASIESASLEASDQSAGMLKRMWDAFVAMLKKIKEAFKKVLKWILGSEKRSKEAVSTMETVTAEIKADERTDPPSTEAEKADVEADKVVIAEAVAVAPSPAITAVAVKAVKSVKEDIAGLKEIVTELEKVAKESKQSSKGDEERVIWGDMPWVPTEDNLKHWREQYDRGSLELITEYLQDAVSPDGIPSRLSGKLLSDVVKELTSSWKHYPELIKDVSSQLKEIELVEERIEAATLLLEAENPAYSSDFYRKLPAKSNFLDQSSRLAILKNLSATVQRVKSDLMKFVNKTETGITKAGSTVKTVASKSKARKGKK